MIRVATLGFVLSTAVLLLACKDKYELVAECQDLRAEGDVCVEEILMPIPDDSEMMEKFFGGQTQCRMHAWETWSGDKQHRYSACGFRIHDFYRFDGGK